jgi:peptidoglycan hydrolase-like protein with peptidoglycan-binding domain
LAAAGRAPGNGLRKTPVLKGAEVDAFERKAAPVAPPLQRGSTGAAVRGLQLRLVKAGFLAPADASTGPGVYGPRTEQAVRRFQEAVGLQATGVAGPSTMAALASNAEFAPSAPKPSDSTAELPQLGANPDITATQPIPVAAVRARLSQTFSEDTDTSTDTQPMLVPVDD